MNRLHLAIAFLAGVATTAFIVRVAEVFADIYMHISRIEAFLNAVANRS